VTVRPGFLFFFSKDWNAGFHDLLLVIVGGTAMFIREDIEVGFSNGLIGRVEAQPLGTFLVDQDDLSFPIHEIDVVPDVIHQVFHQT